MKNTPYVKIYDEMGLLTNPIEGQYINYMPNRASRRSKPNRPFNNRGNHSITYLKGTPDTKYTLLVQTVNQPGRALKHIQHFL